VSPFDTQRFSALSAMLGVAPRHLLVAVARLADDEPNVDPARRQRVVADARVGWHAAEGVAALLATPIASFAQDELDRALASLWPARSEAGD
jgi:hypothetical protein